MNKFKFYYSPHSLLFLILLFLGELESAKILVIHAFYSGSPVMSLRSMGQYLTEHGHRVHYIRWKDGHYHPPLPNGNMTQTVLSVNNEYGQYPFVTKEKESSFDIPYDLLLNKGLSSTLVLRETVNAYPLFLKICDDLLTNKELISFLRKEKFDVAIVDLAGNECVLSLLHHLGVPAVGFWGMQFASGEVSMTVGSPPPSYAPTIFSQLTDAMTFFQRVDNMMVYLLGKFVVWGQCWGISGVVERRIPEGKIPNPCQLLKELSGMIIMSDNHIMDYPQVLPPTFVRALGLHLKPQEKLDPLPEDLESWLSNSGEEGVVYFSAGYTMDPKLFSKRFIRGFLSAAGKLPQRFLMKFDKDGLRGERIPKNVRIMNWIPQQEVLAHNKTRLFLTHCGLHGISESLYYGVPMVGMPIFLDQGDNCLKLENHGALIPLDRETAGVSDIYETLKKGLTQTKYRENAKRLSKLMRDDVLPFPPKERVRHLLEYLARHKGAPHLKIASRNLNFFQHYSIDVLGFLLGSLMLIFYFGKLLLLLVKKVINLVVNSIDRIK